MELSDLDSNEYDTVIRFKRSTPVYPQHAASHPEKTASVTRKVNEQGEDIVCKIGQKQKRMNGNEILSLITAYNDGKTTYELAEQYGCHRQTISSMLKKHGINVTKCKAKEKLNPEDVVFMYENMHTSEEIAKKYKVTPQVIITCLRSHGIKIRDRWDYEKKH